MDLSWVAAVISAIGTIVASYFSYNQYTKNKLTDVKLERWKYEEEKKSALRTANIANIYGELWEVLYEINADRVYILQPHPLVNSMFISISLEVKRNGITSLKEVIQSFKMAEFAHFVGELAKRDYIYYPSVEVDMPEGKPKAYMQMHGTKKVLIKKLSDDGNRWIGSIFADFTTVCDLNIDQAKKEMREAAFNIQYILPEFEVPKDRIDNINI